MEIKEFILDNEDFLDIYEITDLNKKLYEKLKNLKNEYWILTFISKECEFCKIYFPHFVKIYENLSIKVELKIWEDYSENEIDNLIENFKLLGLPTFIFYDINNNEIGRITKEPKAKFFEREILNILTKNSIKLKY